MRCFKFLIMNFLFLLLGGLFGMEGDFLKENQLNNRMWVHGNVLELNTKDEDFKRKGFIDALNQALKKPENQKTDVHLHSTQSVNCLRNIAPFVERLSVGWENDSITMYIKHGAVFPVLKELRIGPNVENGIFFQHSQFPQLKCAELKGKIVEQGLMRTDQLLSLETLCLSDFSIKDPENLIKLLENISKIKKLKTLCITGASLPDIDNKNKDSSKTSLRFLKRLRLWGVEKFSGISIDAPEVWCIETNSHLSQENVNFLKNFKNLSWIETIKENQELLENLNLNCTISYQ